MEIELRKIKITASIIKQLQVASEEQMKTYRVLGYVVYKEYKRILLYNDSTQTLRYMYFYEIELKRDMIQIDSHGTREEQWKTYVKKTGVGSFQTNWTNIETDAKELYTQIESRIREANTIGQIYF